MIELMVMLALFGPPKLPPIGGRAVPAPVEPAVVVEPQPAPTPPPAPASPEPDASPESPSPSSPETVAKGAPTDPPGPEVLANGPSSTPPTTPRLSTGPGTPVRSSPSSTRVGSASTTMPGLRLVSSDELSQWDRQDAAAARAPAGKRTPALAAQADATIVRTATPETSDTRPRFMRPPHPPDRSATVVLGYRYFRIQDALGRAQDWHLASIEVTPMRRYVRLNLLTEFGVEGGEAATRGDRADILLMQRLGLGMQYPHVVTPFLEFQGGVGGARIELFGRNDVALLYALGLDVGAQWALGRSLFVHAAVGWIRPTFVWPTRTLSYDRVAFKLGIGF